MFDGWARDHGVLTIGRLLIQLILDHSREELLGGLLRFVSYRDTFELLGAWSPDHPRLRQLTHLSEHLLDFPDIDVPLTSQPIHLQFGGQMEINYLAIQFSTRRPPHLSARDQLKITCLRTWLLLKALEFADNRHRSDRSLRQICTQLRMGLDDRDSGQKLSWFLEVIEPTRDLQSFESSLRLKLKLIQQEPDLTPIITETIRSLQALLDNRPRPDSTNVREWEFNFPSDCPLPTQVELVAEHEAQFSNTTGTLYLPSDETEDELLFEEVEASEDATPPQVVRESLGIVFQTQEDQQYLPFAWNRLRPDELTALKEAISAAFLAPSASNRLLAAVTALALITRRSLETIESLLLSETTSEEWQLDTTNARLHRTPSRRARRWRADELTGGWVRPLAGTWELQLQPPLLDIFQSASRLAPAATNIGQLWTNADLSLASAFNQWCDRTAGLHRITSGLLVRASEQSAFEQTLDPTFARLITTPYRAGIPGAGAYPSWPHGQVAQVMNQIAAPFATMVPSDPYHNGLGSELDPDDPRLAHAMASTWQTLQNLAEQPDAWLEYHNHLVAYGSLMLLAATGARPVTSVFESSSQFDMLQGCIYLEDKVSHSGQDGTKGRLVPLVPAITDFLTTIYYPHLRRLSEGLRPQLPALAAEIDRQTSGSGSARLPLFFLLRKRPEFDWAQVSESSLRSLALTHWPLPANLFRHRLAVRLRTLGLDPELIDAQLGHAESGSETFGDFSTRCWDTAQSPWRKALDTAYEMLAIRQPAPAAHAVIDLRLAPGYQPFPDQGLFGREARARDRNVRRGAAVQKALKEICDFVGERPVDSIPATEWERLGRQMLLTDKNLRQPNAAVRYQTYEDFLQREWRENGRRPRLRKWLSRLPQPQSVFRPEVIGVTARLSAIRTALDNAHECTAFPPAKSLAAILSALDLCVFGRVTSLEVLHALARGDTDRVRLVLAGQQAYLEFSDVLTKTHSAPVLRYALPSRSARLADHALSAGKTLGFPAQLPPQIHDFILTADLADSRGLSMDGLLKRLAAEVEQENARSLPGVIAAVLAGRLTSYALPWEDWIRVRSGQARHSTNMDSTALEQIDANQREIAVIPRSPIGVMRPAHREPSKQASRQFLGQVRAALTRYTAGRSANDDPHPANGTRHLRTNSDNSLRRDTRTAIHAILQKPDAAVSVAVHSLGAWTLHLLTRPYKKGLLDATSIKRYLDTLAPGFLSFGCDLDLADLDSEDLTDFYRSVVEMDTGHSDSPRNERNGSPGDGYQSRQNQKYVLQRLAEFHQFAQALYGLDAPDWSEIGDGVLGGMAHPGTVTEAEYLHAMQTLCPQPSGGLAGQVRDAFVLLLTYRFGLRGGEALGLRRSEWVEVAGTTVVLVSDRHRQLKTRGSRRQVPLLEPLTQHELRVVQRWLAHWSTETGNSLNIPLFFDEAERRSVADMRPIRQRLITALRASTRSTHVTLHHTRHAYANRMGLHLMAREPSALWPAHHPLDPDRSEAIQRAALLTTRETRRAPWAVARLLGHATPRTTFNSYLHVQFDWAAQRVREMSPSHFAAGPRRKFKMAIDLDLWPVDENYLISSLFPALPEPQVCTPALALKYFRLRFQGMQPPTAGEHCLLARPDWKRIEDSLVLAGQKLAPGIDAGDSEVAAIALPNLLLRHIQKHRWSVLIDYVEQRTVETPVLPPTDNIEAIGQQIGRTRQLLLWEAEHFVQLRQFMEWMLWTEEHVVLYRPAKLDPRLVQSAQNNGYTNLRNNRSDAGRKVLQIDVAAKFQPGKSAINYPDRVAAVTCSANPVAQDNYEFLLLWLAFQLSQQATPGQSTPSAQG